jgi:hypothetical protein
MGTKKLLGMLAIATGLLSMNNVTAQIPAHGSIYGNNVQLYEQGAAGGNVETTPREATVDYKVVTIDSKTWAYLQFSGTAEIGTGADWATQLRYWNSANGKEENNLTDFKDAAGKTVYGSTVKTIPNPVQLSFFQDLNPGGFSETLLLAYDVTAKNSATTETVKPVLSSVSRENLAETSVDLLLTATDNSNNFFYYIKDETNGVSEISFTDQFTLKNLTANTNYNLTITAVDFDGNESDPQTLSFTTKGLYNITSGETDEIRFIFKSTADVLEYYYTFKDGEKKFRDAALEITPAGGSLFEVKPTVSPDGKYCYGISNDAQIANKILNLEIRYMEYKEPLDWGDYVLGITTAQVGGETKSLMHQMGGGIAEEEAETVVPTLTGVTITDITPNYIRLNIAGADNSGKILYEIAGAEKNVTAFTGDYYLTDIKPGNIYTLTVRAKDLSGNVAANEISLTVKAADRRTNIPVGEYVQVAWNSTTLPDGLAEFVVKITQESDQKLTFEGTVTGSNNPEKYFYPSNGIDYHPSITINDVKYDMEGEAPEETGIASAQITFEDAIGTKSIELGAIFDVKWSVFWFPPSAGEFVTGTFTYKFGDYGQEDVEAPEKPKVISLEEGVLTWAPSKDWLSGTKSYNIYANGTLVTSVYDLGNNLTVNVGIASTYEIEAIDFAGNVSEKWNSESDEFISTITSHIQTANIRIYPVPARETLYIEGVNQPETIKIVDLLGKVVDTHAATTKIDVSKLSKGVYFLLIKDRTIKFIKE